MYVGERKREKVGKNNVFGSVSPYLKETESKQAWELRRVV